MNSSPKIMVLKIQEIIYTLVLLFFILTLVLCLFLMFSKRGSRSEDHSSGTTSSLTENDSSGTVPSDTDTSEDVSSDSDTDTAAAASTYIAGVYSSSLTLGDSAAEIQVTVESDRIKAIELVNADEAIEASYPLVSSALENLVTQILEKQKLDGITCSAQNRYTSQLLLNAISKALSLAK